MRKSVPRSSRQSDHKKTSVVWTCLVSGSSGLSKVILQGTVKEGRRQGRQKKRWEDNIKKRTGLEFAKSQKALVVKSSVVPQRPPRFRDR